MKTKERVFWGVTRPLLAYIRGEKTYLILVETANRLSLDYRFASDQQLEEHALAVIPTLLELAPQPQD